MKNNNRYVKKPVLPTKKKKPLVNKQSNNALVHLLRTNKRVKHAMIALCSSVILGVTFGFIFLSMVKQEEPQFASTLHSTTSNTEDEQTRSTSENQVEAIQFYVVQAGLFSEKQNADEWGKQFTALSFPAITWERDGQYFVLTGLGSTESVAKKAADKMDEHDLEVFVKPWEIAAVSNDLTENDVQFLQSFVQIWSVSLETFESESKIETSDWEELISFDGLSEQVEAFQKTIQTAVNEMEQNNISENLFLQLIYEFEKLQ